MLIISLFKSIQKANFWPLNFLVVAQISYCKLVHTRYQPVICQPLYMWVWDLIFTLQPVKATADDKDAIPSNQILYMLDLL